MKKLIVTLAVFTSTTLAAQTIGVHVASYHDTPGFNNDTKGLSLQLDDLVVGTYKNSINNQSVYIAKEFKWSSSFSIYVGGVTGYHQKVMPLVLPTYTVSLSKVDLKLGILPNVKGVTDSTVLHMVVQYKL